MSEFSNSTSIDKKNWNWEIAFIGESTDDRSIASIDYSKNSSERSIFIDYNPIELAIKIENEEYLCHQLEEYIGRLKVKSILLDGTSLSVPTIALLCKALFNFRKVKLSILYVEPESYSIESSSSLNKRRFNLSTKYLGYKGIPSITKSLDIEDDNCIVFFLGFEGTRLETALEELNIVPSDCSLIFGVPSYKAGWETSAFDNNIKSIGDHDLDGRVYFCGADNPDSVIYELKQIRENIGDETKITLIPLGSKPHSIGALLFNSWDKNSTIIYDHPIKQDNRSKKTGAFHLYRVISRS